MKEVKKEEKKETKKLTNKDAIQDLRVTIEKYNTLLTKAVGALEVLEQIEGQDSV